MSIRLKIPATFAGDHPGNQTHQQSMFEQTFKNMRELKVIPKQMKQPDLESAKILDTIKSLIEG